MKAWRYSVLGRHAMTLIVAVLLVGCVTLVRKSFTQPSDQLDSATAMPLKHQPVEARRNYPFEANLTDPGERKQEAFFREGGSRLQFALDRTARDICINPRRYGFLKMRNGKWAGSFDTYELATSLMHSGVTLLASPSSDDRIVSDYNRELIPLINLREMCRSGVKKVLVKFAGYWRYIGYADGEEYFHEKRQRPAVRHHGKQTARTVERKEKTSRVGPFSDRAYCLAADRALTAAECRAFGGDSSFSMEGRAAVSHPREMMRGRPDEVAFSVVAGKDQGRASDLAAVPGNDSQPITSKVRFSRYMESTLSGEGFQIVSENKSAVLDTGLTGEAVWRWSVTPIRADRHYLRVEAWTLRREGAVFVRIRPVYYPPLQIKVPIRWPDRITDWTDDSSDWLAKGANWLKALTAALVAMGAVWTAIRALRPNRSGKAMASDHTY